MTMKNVFYLLFVAVVIGTVFAGCADLERAKIDEDADDQYFARVYLETSGDL